MKNVQKGSAVIMAVALLVIVASGVLIYTKADISNIKDADASALKSTQTTKTLDFIPYYSPNTPLTLSYPDPYAVTYVGLKAQISLPKNDDETLSVQHYPRSLDKELQDMKEHVTVYAGAELKNTELKIGGVPAYKQWFEVGKGVIEKPTLFVKYTIPDGKNLFVIEYACFSKNKKCVSAFEKMITSIVFKTAPLPVDKEVYTEKAMNERKLVETNKWTQLSLSTAMFSYKAEMLGKGKPYTKACDEAYGFIKSNLEYQVKNYRSGNMEMYADALSNMNCKSRADGYVISVPVTLPSGERATLCSDATEVTHVVGTTLGVPDYSTYTCKDTGQSTASTARVVTSPTAQDMPVTSVVLSPRANTNTSTGIPTLASSEIKPYIDRSIITDKDIESYATQINSWKVISNKEDCILAANFFYQTGNSKDRQLGIAHTNACLYVLQQNQQ